MYVYNRLLGKVTADHSEMFTVTHLVKSTEHLLVLIHSFIHIRLMSHDEKHSIQ